MRSGDLGRHCFLDIAIFMADVFESIYARKSPWEKLIDRLGGFYDSRFHGTDWREQEKEYLKKKYW